MVAASNFSQSNKQNLIKEGPQYENTTGHHIAASAFNAAVKDGTVGSKLNRILEATKPEAVYFTEQHGQRGAVLIVDLPEASKLPALVEPWMLIFQADIKLRPFMTPDDLKRAGLDELGKKWS